MKARPNAHIFIVGGDSVSYGGKPPSGTWKEKFFDEVKDQIDTSRVHFFGSLEYAAYITVMQLSKVHVYLTYPFVLSWSLLEAMSMGACVVASDTAPLQEVIIDNMTGRLVNFFDHQALAKSVIQLLHYPEHAKIIGENARNFVKDHYDLQRICLPKQLEWIEHLATQ
jgi:glycosyltransferase involved in cell wall biosynthesis